MVRLKLSELRLGQLLELLDQAVILGGVVQRQLSQGKYTWVGCFGDPATLTKLHPKDYEVGAGGSSFSLQKMMPQSIRHSVSSGSLHPSVDPLGKNSTGEECSCRENHEKVTNFSPSNAAKMHTGIHGLLCI